MDYIEMKIFVKNTDLDILCDKLSDIVTGFVIDDPAVIDDFINDKNSRWDYIEEGLYDNLDRTPSVTLYVEDTEDGKMQAESIRAIAASFAGTELTMKSVKTSDWEDNWKQYYKPSRVGEHLYIRPSWETIDDLEGRIELVMDPASSFGTGSHATTRLCMEQLDKLDVNGKSILDMGCGSGILGCTAMLLGGESLVACDIEENAAKTTAENLVLNNIAPSKFKIYCGDVLSNKHLAGEIEGHGRYDIILANIVSDVLMAMSDYFEYLMQKDGKLILSGIIDERADEVLAHFINKGFVLHEKYERDGWTMYMVGLAG